MNCWLVVGSQATPIDENASGNTHTWLCYVRPLDEASHQHIDKVTFRLHESFTNPNRLVSNAPFEISESGWGEFEIQIKIQFRNASLKPTTLKHMLKLYSDEHTELRGSTVVYERVERLIIPGADSQPDYYIPPQLEEREQNAFDKATSALTTLQSL